MKDTTKNARPLVTTERKIKNAELSGKDTPMSSDYLWFDKKIILAKIGERVYRRKLDDLSDPVKALGELDLWLQKKGIDKKSVFYENVDFFDKLAEGSKKVIEDAFPESSCFALSRVIDIALENITERVDCYSLADGILSIFAFNKRLYEISVKVKPFDEKHYIALADWRKVFCIETGKFEDYSVLKGGRTEPWKLTCWGCKTIWQEIDAEQAKTILDLKNARRTGEKEGVA